MDVIIREALNLTNQSSELRLLYLNLLFGILKYREELRSYKQDETIKLVTSLLDIYPPEDYTYKIVEKIVMEIPGFG